MSIRCRLIVAALVLVVAPLLGCGGAANHMAGSQPSHTSTGMVSITVKWPRTAAIISPHVIPVAANSIAVDFTSTDGQLISHKLIVRPATTASFPSIEPGQFHLTAKAYPGSDGSGVAQAQGQVLVTVIADTITQQAITMASTVDHVGVAPQTLSIAPQQSASVIATAYDPSNAIVLTAPNDWHWSVDNPSVATVQSTSGSTGPTAGLGTATVTGVASGYATVTVTESNSQKTAPISVAVSGSTTGPSVTVQAIRVVHPIHPGDYVLITQIVNDQFIGYETSPDQSNAIPIFGQLNGSSSTGVTAQPLPLPSGSSNGYAWFMDQGAIFGSTPSGTQGKQVDPVVWASPISAPQVLGLTSYAIEGANAQEILGAGFNSNGVYLAFSYNLSSRTTIVLNGMNGLPKDFEPQGLNEAGTIVGVDGSGNCYSLQVGSAQASKLTVGTNATISSMNGSGTFTGSSGEFITTTRAFIAQNNLVWLYEMPGTYTVPFGIDTAGDVVGYMDDNSQSNPGDAVLWEPRAYTSGFVDLNAACQAATSNGSKLLTTPGKIDVAWAIDPTGHQVALHQDDPNSGQTTTLIADVTIN